MLPATDTHPCHDRSSLAVIPQDHPSPTTNANLQRQPNGRRWTTTWRHRIYLTGRPGPSMGAVFDGHVANLDDSWGEDVIQLILRPSCRAVLAGLHFATYCTNTLRLIRTAQCYIRYISYELFSFDTISVLYWGLYERVSTLQGECRWRKSEWSKLCLASV